MSRITNDISLCFSSLFDCSNRNSIEMETLSVSYWFAIVSYMLREYDAAADDVDDVDERRSVARC